MIAIDELKTDDVVYCAGLDDNCHTTIERVTFTRRHEDGKRVVVRCDDGVSVIMHPNVLHRDRQELESKMMRF